MTWTDTDCIKRFLEIPSGFNKNSERISQTFPRDSPKVPRDPPRFNNHSERISYTFPRDPPKNGDKGQRKTRITWGELEN